MGGGGKQKKTGSDIGRPQGPTMAQRGVSMALETKAVSTF